MGWSVGGNRPISRQETSTLCSLLAGRRPWGALGSPWLEIKRIHGRLPSKGIRDGESVSEQNAETFSRKRKAPQKYARKNREIHIFKVVGRSNSSHFLGIVRRSCRALMQAFSVSEFGTLLIEPNKRVESDSLRQRFALTPLAAHAQHSLKTCFSDIPLTTTGREQK